MADGADTFLFGSRSKFDTLCREVVTELKEQYPHIKRINYNAPHETAITLQEERQRFEQIYSRLTSSEVHLQEYEGQSIRRNQQMPQKTPT